MCLGVPGVIREIVDYDQYLAKVDFGGVTREISLMALASTQHELDALTGSWVIVHAGFALAGIDEEAARQSLRLHAEMSEEH